MLVRPFNKEKTLVATISGHYETSRRFVDSSTSRCLQSGSREENWSQVISVTLRSSCTIELLYSVSEDASGGWPDALNIF